MTVETRRFIASAFMLVVIVGLIGYLTFIPVPEGNKDLIITIMGVLLGACTLALPNLFGDRDAEKEKLRQQIAAQDARIAQLQTAYDTLHAQHERLVNMLVERHIIEARGIEFSVKE